MRSLASFESIQKEMSRQQVHSLVGQPDSTTGSGLYIEVYDLPDQSSVLIGWTGPFEASELVYVKHRSKHGDRDLLPAK